MYVATITFPEFEEQTEEQRKAGAEPKRKTEVLELGDDPDDAAKTLNARLRGIKKFSDVSIRPPFPAKANTVPPAPIEEKASPATRRVGR